MFSDKIKWRFRMARWMIKHTLWMFKTHGILGMVRFQYQSVADNIFPERARKMKVCRIMASRVEYNVYLAELQSIEHDYVTPRS